MLESLVNSTSNEIKYSFTIKCKKDKVEAISLKSLSQKSSRLYILITIASFYKGYDIATVLFSNLELVQNVFPSVPLTYL